MSLLPLLAVLLCIVLASVSVFRIARLPVSRPFKLLLAGMRIILFTLLAAMFFEPVLMFERLSAPAHTVPVLIDDSQSMSLFSPDKNVLPVIARLQQWNSANHTGKFVFYCFGDSLRRLDGKQQPLWADRHSLFPASSKEKRVQQASAMLILSDGNWSNSSLPGGFFADKSVWYLPLPEGAKSPYLRIDVKDFPATVPADSGGAANIVCEGIAGRADSLEVTVYEGNTRFLVKTATVPEGFFSCPLPLHFPARPAGRHLYRFSARLKSAGRADAWGNCFRYATQTVIPGHFTYSFFTVSPTLDSRFLRLALAQDRDFAELPADAKSEADLIAFFGWNGEADGLATRLKRNGVALFAGTLPGGAALIPSRELTITRSRNDGFAVGPFEDVNLARLPPPSRFLDAGKGSVQIVEPILSGIVAGQKSSDTLPMLFTGSWKGRRCVVYAANDLWKWDFWPLAIEPAEEKALSVSNRFVSLIKGLLVDGLSGQLLLYPPEMPVEIDSLALRVLVPADLPLGADLRLTCSFTSNALHYDTTFTMTAAGGSDRSLRLRPLPEGRYRFDATARSGGGRFSFGDSLTVGEDRSELMVDGQNLGILQEIGQPLTDLGDSSLASIFSPLPGGERVKEYFPIRRTWPLLLLVFLVLAGEWIARRMTRLD